MFLPVFLLLSQTSQAHPYWITKPTEESRSSSHRSERNTHAGGETSLDLWYSHSSWKTTSKDLESEMGTSGIYNLRAPQRGLLSVADDTQTHKQTTEPKHPKRCVWRAGYWGGILEWKYERRLVLTCENGCSGWAFVLPFAYDCEVSFVWCLSGLISIWKGYFFARKQKKKNLQMNNKNISQLGRFRRLRGLSGAPPNVQNVWSFALALFLNIPSHGTFSLLIKMEMRWSRPTWGGKVMTRVDLFFFLFIFQIHSLGRGRNGCWPCVRNQSLHTPARERGGGKKKKNDTNAPYEKRQIGSTAGARGKRRQTFSPGPWNTSCRKLEHFGGLQTLCLQQ